MSMSFQFNIVNSIAQRCKHAAEQIYIGKTKLEIKRRHKEIQKNNVFAFANYPFYVLASCLGFSILWLLPNCSCSQFWPTTTKEWRWMKEIL